MIRLLLDKGANVALQSGAGETAQDWARKLASPTAMSMLSVTPRQDASPTRVTAAQVDAENGGERSLALLESSSQKFSESSGCASCHHQNATSLAASEARSRGLRVNEQAALARIEMINAGVPPPPIVAERMDVGVTGFSRRRWWHSPPKAPRRPPRRTCLRVLAATQAPDGSWHISSGIGDRPPTAEGAITRVALGIRSLKVYAPPARATEMNARVLKAREWLQAAKPLTAEDRNMQLLGLHWAGADGSTLAPLGGDSRRAAAGRRWRQQPALASDAYATGQSLYVLAKAGGVAATDSRYQNGVRYLLATQSENGSWHVASRAPKFQALFNSGFPYAGDQWISAWATSWATMALAQAVPPVATRAAR